VLNLDEVQLDAGDPDQFYDFEAPTGLTEDTWLQSVEVHPRNRTVAHHVILWQGGDNEGQRGWIGAWAAGMDPMKFPAKTGRQLKAGSKIIGDMHYHPADTPQTDQTSVGLFFLRAIQLKKS
jgi:hypothetical protein